MWQSNKNIKDRVPVALYERASPFISIIGCEMISGIIAKRDPVKSIGPI